MHPSFFPHLVDDAADNRASLALDVDCLFGLLLAETTSSEAIVVVGVALSIDSVAASGDITTFASTSMITKTNEVFFPAFLLAVKHRRTLYKNIENFDDMDVEDFDKLNANGTKGMREHGVYNRHHSVCLPSNYNQDINSLLEEISR